MTEYGSNAYRLSRTGTGRLYLAVSQI